MNLAKFIVGHYAAVHVLRHRLQDGSECVYRSYNLKVIFGHFLDSTKRTGVRFIVRLLVLDKVINAGNTKVVRTAWTLHGLPELFEADAAVE